MQVERRRTKRIAATAFLNRSVEVAPLPPFFGRKTKGKLIDLSSGGMAILIGDLIPQESMLRLRMTFPDHTIFEAVARVVRSVPKGRDFLHGLEFLSVAGDMERRIERMSADFIDCESRIRSGETPACRAECAFFPMCHKPEKLAPPELAPIALQLETVAQKPALPG